jgi:acetyl esterase/lipase
MLSAATALLLLGGTSLTATAAVLLRAKRPEYLMPLYFMVAWLQGELAQFHIVWQGLLALVLVSLGALAETRGQWGLLFLLLSLAGLGFSLRLAAAAKQTLEDALVAALGPDYRQQIPADRRALLCDSGDWREWMRPFSMQREGVECLRDIPYGGAGKRNLLDVYRPASFPASPAPVLLQVHGGGWTIGDKTQQALPLMNHLAQRGWVCVAINYRLSPRHAFPAHIEDTKLAIAWIKQHIAAHGGDPRFIAITGGSAGGHLSSLAALTPNKPEFQGGAADADTSVQAAVPFYGVYDWLQQSGQAPNKSMHKFLVSHVLQSSPEENQQLWHMGRPLANINTDAPPMFVIHGSHDSLVRVEEARHFASALSRVSAAPVAYAELRGGQHAFEVFHSIRSDHAMHAAARFLEWSHARWAQQLPPPEVPEEPRL